MKWTGEWRILVFRNSVIIMKITGRLNCRSVRVPTFLVGGRAHPLQKAQRVGHPVANCGLCIWLEVLLALGKPNEGH